MAYKDGEGDLVLLQEIKIGGVMGVLEPDDGWEKDGRIYIPQEAAPSQGNHRLCCMVLFHYIILVLFVLTHIAYSDMCIIQLHRQHLKLRMGP